MTMMMIQIMVLTLTILMKYSIVFSATYISCLDLGLTFSFLQLYLS